MTRVLMVEDNAIVRNSLRILVEGIDRNIEIIGEARDGIEALEMAGTSFPDSVLINIQMPRMNGLEATKKMHADNPDIPVLILSSFDNQALICQSLRNGAMGYVRKKDAFTELGPAILAVCHGEMY